jgi:hypothetical protein
MREKTGDRPSDRLDEFMRMAQINSEGLPVGVQVATLPNNDELCLHLMEQIEKAIRFNDMQLLY